MLKQKHDSKFVSIKDVSTISPMFENIWGAYLAVFSTLLETTDDLMIADICLQGFIHAIRISGHFEMDEIRENFVSSLATLTNISDTKEIKQKNLNCIRELINLAVNNGDCLRDSWKYVLQCISSIDHMRVLGEDGMTDSEFFQTERSSSRSSVSNISEQDFR